MWPFIIYYSERGERIAASPAQVLCSLVFSASESREREKGTPAICASIGGHWWVSGIQNCRNCPLGGALLSGQWIGAHYHPYCECYSIAVDVPEYSGDDESSVPNRRDFKGKGANNDSAHCEAWQPAGGRRRTTYRNRSPASARCAQIRVRKTELV